MGGQEQVLDINAFKGLNRLEDPSRIDDRELTELINFNIGLGGEVLRRPGFVLKNPTSSLGAQKAILLAHFKKTGQSDQLIALCNGILYKSLNGETWTSLGAFDDINHAIQYADKLYLVRTTDRILEYDGTTVTALAGSPSGTHVLTFKDRLFVLNSLGSNRDRLFFSAPGDPTTWPADNFIDIAAGDGDFLVATHPYQDRLIIFKSKTTHVLFIQGLPVNWVVRLQNGELGCNSKDSIVEANGLIYFTHFLGVYQTDSITFKLISDALEPIFTSVAAGNVNGNFAVRWRDKVIFQLDSPIPDSVYYFVYHYKINAWSEWEFLNISPAFSMIAIQDFATDLDQGIYIGSFSLDGKVYFYSELEPVYTDDGHSYQSSLITKAYDLGSPIKYKRGKWAALSLRTFDEDVEIDFRYDVDNTEEPVSTFALNVNRHLYKMPGPGFFRLCSFRIITSSNASVEIYGIQLVFHIKRNVILTGV